MTALHQGFVDVWMHEGYVSCTGTVSYDAQGDPGHLLFVFKEAEASREWGYRVPLGDTAAPRPSLDVRRAAELLALAERELKVLSNGEAWSGSLGKPLGMHIEPDGTVQAVKEGTQLHGVGKVRQVVTRSGRERYSP